jgi:hypothetical protein
MVGTAVVRVKDSMWWIAFVIAVANFADHSIADME